ncbi:MAG: N-6 DNA methylase [Minisyncoccia bacterium]
MTNIKDLENRLWEAADHMRANTPLRLNEFAEPVLGLIFLKFAGVKHSKVAKEIAEEKTKKTKSHGGASVSRERPTSSADYHARGVLFVPEKARFSYLIELPEGTDMGRAVNDAMKEIEAENKELAGILPKTFQKLDNRSIIALLKNFNQIPDDIEGDAFGRIYEYFLGKFALADGSRGGEFFTPTSIVKLIVEIIEPYRGRIYDPACGSGGMFVQSHEFVKRHLENGNLPARGAQAGKARASREIAIYGQEKTDQTVRIAKMNLAIHGLSGDIREGNTYYEDRHKSLGKFDFTMANPPFNVSGIDYERIKDDPRFPYGLPRSGNKGSDNGNYIWIQIFLSSLNKNGRTGFVMSNAAGDVGHREKEIRQRIIEDGLVDVMVAVGPNMFYNVPLSVTLWFLDKGKPKERKDKILFIDARNIFTPIPGDRVKRHWTDEQIERIASIVQSYRGENGKKYQNIKGLCKVATIDEVKKAGYSLNPGRYVGVTDNGNGDEGNFGEKVKKLHSELKGLTDEAHELENKIFENLKKLDI